METVTGSQFWFANWEQSIRISENTSKYQIVEARRWGRVGVGNLPVITVVVSAWSWVGEVW